MSKKKFKDVKRLIIGKLNNNNQSKMLNNAAKTLIDTVLEKILLLHQQNKIKGALIFAEKALAIFPNNLALLGNVGALNLMTGNLEAAEKHMLESSKPSLNNTQIHNNLGSLYQKQHHHL